jgi:hypothetical protein
MRPIPCPVTAEELHRLYREEKLTDAEIVDRLGLDVTLKRVRSWRKRFCIETVQRTERHEVVPIEGRLRSFLVGSMLGDGSLQRLTHSTRFRENHGNDQKEYLQWKVSEWGTWVKSGVKSVTWTLKGKDFQGWRFETAAHRLLNQWFDLFYGTSTVKRLRPEVIQYVDAFALAIWYMDDGSIGWWPRITFGLSPESRQIAFDIFAKFSLYPRWEWHTETTGDFIFDGEEQAHLFISLVKPHMPECMTSKKLTFGFQGPHYQVRKTLTREALQELATEGVPLREIGRRLNVGYNTVSRYLKEFGIEHPRTVGRPKAFVGGSG